MTSAKLTELPAATTLDGLELYYSSQGGVSVKVTGAQIKTLVSNSPTLVTPNLGTPSAGVGTNLTGIPISTALTGAGTGVLTALGINIGSAGAFTTFNGAHGTPSSITLTNATGLPVSTGISGFGTGVATALAVSVGSAGAFVTFNGAGGTPSSLTLTSATGLPVSTGISGLGTGVATMLATFSSANIASACTDETGSGALVFGTAPVIGNPTVTNYTETLYSPSANSAFTVSLSNGTVQLLTTNANCTVTLPSSTAGKSYVIIIAYGGAHTLTWAGGTTIKWAGGTTPTPTSVNGKFDIFSFFCDGTNTYGAVFGQNY